MVRGVSNTAQLPGPELTAEHKGILQEVWGKESGYTALENQEAQAGLGFTNVSQECIPGLWVKGRHHTVPKHTAGQWGLE